MISHKLQFIYIHLNKTGGRSVNEFFNSRNVTSKGEGAYTRRVYNVKGRKWRVDHRPLIYWERKYPDLYPTYFKWSTIRNPWDRLVSWWKSRGHELPWKNLKQYIKNTPEPGGPHPFSQRWFLDSKGEMGLDFIAKLENIEEDFKYVCSKIDMPYEKLVHIGKSHIKGGPPYWKYYDEESKNIVYERNKDIIERFSYEFGK
jgi:hypothetical protein